MKLSKNLMRLLQVNSMTAIAADRLSPRNLTSRMFRHLYALLLLAVMTIAGSGNAWGQLSLGKATIDAAPTSISKQNAMTKTGKIVGAWYQGTSDEGTYGARTFTIDDKTAYYVKLGGNGQFKLRVTKGSVHVGDILRVDCGGFYNDGKQNDFGFCCAPNATNTTKHVDESVSYTTVDCVLTASNIQTDDEDGSYDMIVIKRSNNGSDGSNSGMCYHGFEIIRPSGIQVNYSSNDNTKGTVTATYDGGTALTSGDYVPEGTQVTFNVTRLNNELLWYRDVNGERVFNNSETVTFTMTEGQKDGDKAVVVKDGVCNIQFHFETIVLNCYTENAKQGTVVIKNSSSQEATTWRVTPYPGVMTYVATPQTGYRFVGWYSNSSITGEPVSTSESYSIGNPSASKDLWAHFEEDAIAVTFGGDNDVFGSVVAVVDGVEYQATSSPLQVVKGKEVTFRASNNSGVFYYWKDENNDLYYHTNPITRTVGDAGITMNAHFVQGIHIVASNTTPDYGSVVINHWSNNHGTNYHITPNPGAVKFVAAPATGATFVGWFTDEACETTPVSTEETYTVESITDQNYTLYAKFSVPEGYGIVWKNVTIPTGCDAWYTIGDDETKHRESYFGIPAETSKICLRATDANNNDKIIDCWDFGSKTGGNALYTNANNRDVPKNNWTEWAEANVIKLTPHFVDAYTYKATAGVGCSSISVEAKKTVEGDEIDVNGIKQKTREDAFASVTFTASAADGRTFDGWYDANGDKVVDATATYTIENPTKENMSLEARFSAPAPIGGQRIKSDLINIGTGSNLTWENGHLTTEATSYNHVDIFRFGSIENANVSSASEYTGIRFHVSGPISANATAFRVLVYVKGETNARITNIAAGNKDYAFSWTELGVAADKVANIERVCFAGQQNGPTDVVFDNVWIEKIDDPCHTFVTYDNDIKKYSFDTNKYTYTLSTPEGDATAVFSNISGASRRSYTNEIKLENDLVITAPTGKYIKAVKIITDGTAESFTFHPRNVAEKSHDAYTKAITNGNEVVWTHGENTNTLTIKKVDAIVNIAKVEIVYTNNSIQPALTKKANGIYTANLAKITADGWSSVAYDEENTTVYNSKNSTYCGNFNVIFETAQDLTKLSKIVIDYSGDKVGNVLNILSPDGTEVLAKYSFDGGTINFSSDDAAKLTNVKTIRFNNGDGTVGAMKLNSIDFYISHIAPAVALDEGINTEYTISLGHSVKLSAHATAGEDGPGAVVWREWDNTNHSVKTGGMIGDDKAYSTSYTFTPTETGDYYFAARAHQTCTASCPDQNWHASTPVVVTVHVVKNNIYENLLLDFTDNEYTELGNENKGREYRIYVPQSIVNGDDALKQNVPVVFSLHGTSNDNNPADGGVQDFNELAETNKFIVVYPRGRNDITGLWGRGWEATGVENQDTKFLDAIITDLKGNRPEFVIDTKKQFSIDESRIYITGFSNGGMMAYAAANVMANKFAAFGSIAGYPINEMHLQHTGDRPVPFLHIQGTKDEFVKYSLMPAIVDNMIFRNGCDIAPVSVENGSATTIHSVSTTYKKSEYGNGEAPYIYYEVGTGMNTSDTGMEHDYQCTFGTKSSMEVMWDFFNDKTLPKSPIVNPFVFKANITTANNVAREHGWEINSGSRIIAQYGESGGYTDAGQNVYHSLQLKEKTYSIKFTATSSKECDVEVLVSKLADRTSFSTMGKTNFPVNETVVLDKAYKIKNGEISIPFDATDGEYKLTIKKINQNDAITISNVSIVEGETKMGEEAEDELDTDFTGYFNYNNRLFAQWNFDLCDGSRFDGKKIKALLDSHDTDIWEADLTNTNATASSEATNGTIIYTYTKPLGNPDATGIALKNEVNYEELTYSRHNDFVPVSAGLKFNAPANSIKVYVDLANGQVTGTHLVVDDKVKMLVPYVKNSYRNDKGNVTAPQDNIEDFQNCMHHVNRDILYIALNSGSVWDVWNGGHRTIGHIKNERIDVKETDEGLERELLGNGGDEYVNGKNYYKGDYRGTDGVPCVLQFNKETVIDRIGVNRNLVYSFYTEYINELGYNQPKPGMRIVGSPTGANIANTGDWANYNDAIAMTYGGWVNVDNSSTYSRFDGTTVTDVWDELGVFNGQATENKGTYKVGDDVFATFADLATVPTSNVTAAIDGFPVVTKSVEHATSEALVPTTADQPESELPNYHPHSEGLYSTTGYEANSTPWTLPNRGAFVKFEPTLPGVLNVNIVQMGKAIYYIADEFGKSITENVFSRSAQGKTVNPISIVTTGSEKGFKVEKTDYVKHSFNVYPGKTYYVFSNTAGMGVAGFYFEPNVNREVGAGEFDRIYVGMKKTSISDDVAYSVPTNLDATENLTSPTATGSKVYTMNYSKKAAMVSYERAFDERKWGSICLPFSLNKSQVENIFGKGTRLILLRDIQEAGTNGYTKTTINFISHANEDIIAGYPYFIYPTQPVTRIEANVSFADDIPEIPSVDSGEKFDGMDGYVFTGTFATDVKLPKDSYVISKKNGTLSRTTKDTGTSIKPYRAYLSVKVAAAPKPLMACNMKLLDEEATMIEDVISSDEVITNDNVIYDISGKIVSKDSQSLKNLQKGIYMVNGKKFVVK